MSSSSFNPATVAADLGGGGGGTGPWINVMDYGAVGNVRTVYDGSITSGTNQLHSTNAAFTSADNGKSVVVRGARTGPLPLFTTITSVSGGVATLANNATVTVASGGRIDFGTPDIDAFNAAVAAVPAAGGTVYVPAGRYFLRMTQVQGELNLFIDRSNINIVGEGIGQSVILYGSSADLGLVGISTIGPGSGIFLGYSAAVHRSNITLSDFTIEDIYTGTVTTSGHNPSAVDVAFVDNIRIQRVEIVNSKGNGAITIVGDNGTNTDAYVVDCLIRGDSSGGWIEGDGINIGEYSHVYVLNNRITGVKRHGYEGGARSYQQWIDSNDIDMLSQGFDGINPTDANRTIVSNNKVRNVASSQYGIDFSVDIGAFTVYDIDVINNYVTGALAGVKFQNTSGGASYFDRLTVRNNYISSSYGIYLGSDQTPNLTVEGNVFVNTGEVFHAIAGSPPAPPDGVAVIIQNNRSTAGVKIINFSEFNNWASTRVRVENNIIGDTPSDANIGHYGGAAFTQTSDVSAVASLTTRTFAAVTLTGALVTDYVTFTLGSGYDKRFIYFAAVTSANTITLYAFNPTASGIGMPFNDPVYLFAHRH